MGNRSEKSDMWNLLIIPDSKGLQGTTIGEVINRIALALDIKFVVVHDIQGAGINSLVGQNLFELTEFFKAVSQVKQFDWGDFFLFDHNSKIDDNFLNLDYPDMVLLTETTIRAVDDTYIYIYTPYNNIVRLISENYTVESIVTDKLENLEYPY